MNVLTEEQEAQLVARFRAMGHPDPEGAVADSMAKLSAALKSGELTLGSRDGQIVVKAADAMRLWPKP